MLVLTGVLAKPARLPPQGPVLKAKTEDLKTYARMLDSVAIEPELLSNAPDAVLRELSRADTMSANGETRDAIARLDRIAQRIKTPGRAFILARIGLLHHQLRDNSATVLAFEQALTDADSLLAARLSFNVGFLFQHHGQPDSARTYYLRTQAVLKAKAAPGEPYLTVPYLAGLLNNLGVALSDKPAALDYFRQAAAVLDTLAQTRDASRLLDNLHSALPAAAN
jgi:hypothetical protein